MAFLASGCRGAYPGQAAGARAAALLTFLWILMLSTAVPSSAHPHHPSTKHT